MKVILLQDIPKIGNRYDVKEFKEGYAQNVLLSKGLAELATPQALAKLEARNREMHKKKEEESRAFDELISKVNNKTITIEARANEKGSLFKQVSSKDIAEAIYTSSNVKINDENIIIGHIKEVGKYPVRIKKGEKQGTCEIVVTAI